VYKQVFILRLLRNLSESANGIREDDEDDFCIRHCCVVNQDVTMQGKQEGQGAKLLGLL
jgi:hypothetical protein